MRCCYLLSCLQHVTETAGVAPDDVVHLMTKVFAIAEFTKFTGIICAKVHLLCYLSLNCVYNTQFQTENKKTNVPGPEHRNLP